MANLSPQDIARSLLDKIPGKHTKTPGGWSFRCPAHSDKKASAAIYVKSDGVAFTCFANCSTDDFCNAIGVTKSYLQANSSGGSGVQVAYSYTDANGFLLYEHLRMKPTAKAKFYYRRFDSQGREVWTLYGGWFESNGHNKLKKIQGGDDPQQSPQAGAVWLDESPRVLYRLPKLKAAAPGSLVIWNEGEKDVQTAELWNLLSTTAGGARDWREHFADDLAGFDLVIIADNDAPGRMQAAQVAMACYGKAARVRVIEALPGVKEKGDLSDWAGMGKTREDLLALIEATPDYAPTGEVIEDESTAVEVELDDGPLNEDPKIDKYLRQIARNAAKVNDAVDLISRKLGFQDDHSRLLAKLGSIAPEKLGTISCCHDWLAKKYGKSVSTVARDIRKLRDEQERTGVELIGYTEGTYNPQTETGYASKFRRNYLRWALEAIGLAIQTRGDLEYSHDALNRACDEVAKRVPRKPVADVVVVATETDARAEKRAEPDRGPLLSKHKLKATAAMKRLLQAMSDDGLSLEDAELILSDAFNDATDSARERVATKEAAEPTAAADDADYIKIVETPSVNTMIDGLHDGQNGAGSAFAYGLQNDDHRRIDEDPQTVTESHEIRPLATEDYYQQDLRAGKAGLSPSLPFEQDPDAFVDSQAEAMLAADLDAFVGESQPASVGVSMTGIVHTAEQKAAFRRRDIKENFACQWHALEHGVRPLQELWSARPDESEFADEYDRIKAAYAARDGKPNCWRGWVIWKAPDGAAPFYITDWWPGDEPHATGVCPDLPGSGGVPASSLDFSPWALVAIGRSAADPPPDEISPAAEPEQAEVFRW